MSDNKQKNDLSLSQYRGPYWDHGDPTDWTEKIKELFNDPLTPRIVIDSLPSTFLNEGLSGGFRRGELNIHSALIRPSQGKTDMVGYMIRSSSKRDPRIGSILDAAAYYALQHAEIQAKYFREKYLPYLDIYGEYYGDEEEPNTEAGRRPYRRGQIMVVSPFITALPQESAYDYFQQEWKPGAGLYYLDRWLWNSVLDYWLHGLGWKGKNEVEKWEYRGFRVTILAKALGFRDKPMLCSLFH